MYDLYMLVKKVRFYLFMDKAGAVATEYVILLAATSMIATGVGAKIQQKAGVSIENIEFASAGSAGGDEGSDGEATGSGGKGGKK